MKLTDQEWSQVQRYVIGSANIEEIRWVENKMRKDSVFHSFVKDLSAIWSVTPEKEFFVDADKAWDTFRLRNQYRPYLKEVNHRTLRSKPNSNKLYGWVRAAAVILVGVVAGYLIHDRVGEIQVESGVVSDFNRMQEMTTDRGEKAKVTFSDGSTVTLNSSSQIRFPDNFNQNYREVYLEGEAFFSVSHSSDRPFVVHTNSMEVEVLGTSFNVRSWTDDDASEVAVRDGRVAVRSSGSREEGLEKDGLILEADEYTRVKRGDRPRTVEKMDVEKVLLWTAGGLYFNNTRFIQVVRDLERRFDLTVELVGMDPERETLTGTFYDSELNKILSVIATTMRAEVERNGSSVTFRRKGDDEK